MVENFILLSEAMEFLHLVFELLASLSVVMDSGFISLIIFSEVVGFIFEVMHLVNQRVISLSEVVVLGLPFMAFLIEDLDSDVEVFLEVLMLVVEVFPLFLEAMHLLQLVFEFLASLTIVVDGGLVSLIIFSEMVSGSLGVMEFHFDLVFQMGDLVVPLLDFVQLVLEVLDSVMGVFKFLLVFMVLNSEVIELFMEVVVLFLPLVALFLEVLDGVVDVFVLLLPLVALVFDVIVFLVEFNVLVFPLVALFLPVTDFVLVMIIIFQSVISLMLDM
jgi:hypothetical protein